MSAEKNNSGNLPFPGNPSASEKVLLRKRMREECLKSNPDFSFPAGENPGLKKTAATIAKEFNTVFAFISVKGEPDTSFFIKAAVKERKTILVPKINGKDMYFLPFPLNPEKLAPNKFGIPEPTEGEPVFPCAAGLPGEKAFPFPAFILVPGSAFTKKGERLGRGGGYYDRFLEVFLDRYSMTNLKFKTAGFCFPGQILQTIPVEKHDVKMDCLLLPDGSIIDTGTIH